MGLFLLLFNLKMQKPNLAARLGKAFFRLYFDDDNVALHESGVTLALDGGTGAIKPVLWPNVLFALPRPAFCVALCCSH